MTIGEKLRGKLYVDGGMSDNNFLNNAVYRIHQALESFRGPAYDDEVTCATSIAGTAIRIEKRARAGADLTSRRCWALLRLTASRWAL